MSEDPVFSWADIDQRRRQVYEAYDRYYVRRCRQAYATRGERWHRDFSSPEAYERSVQPNRQSFLRMLGGWPWERGDLRPRVERLAETDRYTLDRVWLTVFENVQIDCLLLTPPNADRNPAVLAQHGLNGTPEDVCGFIENVEQSSYNKIGIRLAERGFVVIAPHMAGGYGQPVKGAGHLPGLEGAAWGRARTQLYRKAMLVGERLMGAEMFSLSRALDYLETLPTVDPARLGMYGLSQGGQSALWFPALDTRIKASVAAAFYNSRLEKMIEPSDSYTAYLFTEEEDKFFVGQLLEFADSDIASLICPRAFMVEAGKQDGAVYWELAAKAFDELKAIYERLGVGDRADLCLHEGGHECRAIESLDFLAKWL